MATTDKIIDEALKAIGDDPADPQQMTRAEVLFYIDDYYRNTVGKRIKSLAVYTYDGSDAAHTVTDGVASLPDDFLEPVRVYDGDAPGDVPLTQILQIDDKVADDAGCSQYMLPDRSTMWIFGQTPTNAIKLYYHRQPAALTDFVLSSPSMLKEEFHIDIFVARIKEVYEYRNGNYYDGLGSLKAYIVGLLNQIEAAHSVELRDENDWAIRVE